MKRATIVGLGLIGGSLALDLKQRKFVEEVYGVDSDPGHLKKAKERALVDQVLPLPQALRMADLVILAIPVNAIAALLPEVLEGVSKGATVTDMGSTKGVISTLAKSLPRRKQLVLSHPMAGTENSGPDAALTGLFDGRTTVVCDSEQSDPEHLDRILKMYETLKMRVVYMNSEDHDLHVAYVSHLSHITSFVLANTVLDKEKNVDTIFDLAGGGFESTVRLAKSSPEMWNPIFEQNISKVTEALGSYIEHLQGFHRALKDRDMKKIGEWMTQANEIRRVLSSIRSSR